MAYSTQTDEWCQKIRIKRHIQLQIDGLPLENARGRRCSSSSYQNPFPVTVLDYCNVNKHQCTRYLLNNLCNLQAILWLITVAQ